MEFKIWIIISDYGLNILGFGSDNNIFFCEYFVNFIVVLNRGINFIYWWRFDDNNE